MGRNVLIIQYATYGNNNGDDDDLRLPVTMMMMTVVRPVMVTIPTNGY